MSQPVLSLFKGYGIEIEYMLVERQTLKVSPVCDKVITSLAGETVNEFEMGPVAISNELANHVIELKTNGPADSLENLAEDFHTATLKIESTAQNFGATLLGTGMHPTMIPANDTQLWPHGQSEIYSAYDAIFGCKGHGWSNLQSVHINLPFANDEEFFLLHNAIRAILPLIPALSASTPVCESKFAANKDQRLKIYSENQKIVPQITGVVIPESIHNAAEYEQVIFEPMYAQMRKKFNADHLCHEWLNSRGAIARFDRNAIEIRVIDTQESAKANLSVVKAVVNAVQFFSKPEFASLAETLDQQLLVETFWNCVQFGSQCVTNTLTEKLMPDAQSQKSAQDFWQFFLPADEKFSEVYLRQGTLAERIVANYPERETSKEQIITIYRQLNNCLFSNSVFEL